MSLAPPRHPLASGLAPAWATTWGRDRYGLFAGFALEGCEHRFRWIPPGRFLMGSPDEEVGHWSDETQHPVTLTSGFWLGEFPVTQDLWRAVMGKNPSDFRGDRRPVEKISLDDAVAFLERLNTMCPGLGASLPTEAQWEYACRAGTREATYAGDLSDEDRDSVLDAIAWYAANSDEGTERVGGKRPNAWGLHDMLGNVLEWCRDGWIADLGPEPAQDPLNDGVTTREDDDETPLRVVRGGSWSSPARLARAAFRGGYLPGHRLRNLGFRLSRGQEP